MSFKRIIFFAVLLLAFLKPYAQVNLQTGSATFSLPLFDWKDDKSRLTALVALSYNSGSGFKVNDVPSSVGQGWNLVAGGSIVRMQVGEPDDQQAYQSSDPNATDVSRYPAGRMYATHILSNGCPLALARYPIYKGMNHLYTQHNATEEDKQLDYFMFQFNGKSGMFVLDIAAGVGRAIGDNKMKISFQTNTNLTYNGIGIRTTISSFTIQDVDGLSYVFSKYSLTKVLHADFTDKNMTTPLTQPTFAKGHVYYQSGFENASIPKPYVINGWYLTEIDDVLAGKHVTFNYPNYRSLNNTAGYSFSYNNLGDYIIVSRQVSETETPILQSIVCSDNKHVITFNDGASRFDLPGDKALGSIDISYNGRILSRYLLNTTYFLRNRYGTPVTPAQTADARLCLRSVQKIGVDLKDDSPPYMFDYYLGSGTGNDDDFVPPPFFYARDIWGFYNGHNSVQDDNNNTYAPVSLYSDPLQLGFWDLKGLCFLNNTAAPSGGYLNPKANYASNGLLKQIIYPTGGALKFDYDQNRAKFGDPGSTTEGMVGGVHVSKTSSTDGGNSNGCGLPVVTQYWFTTGGQNGPSSLWGMEKPVNSMPMNSHYESEHRKYHWTLGSAPFGECYWNNLYPGILSAFETVSISEMQRFLAMAAPVLGAISIITDIMDVATLINGGGVTAVIIDVIGGLLTLGFTCFSGNNSKDNNATVYYNDDLNAANPLPAQFKRVEVVENTGDIGRTVHLFTSEDDYSLWVGYSQNGDFSAKQRFAPWAYGLPLQETAFDANSKMVKQVTNTYGWTDQDCNTPPQQPWAVTTPPIDMIAIAGPALKGPAADLNAFHPMVSLCPAKPKRPLNLKSFKCNIRRTVSQNNQDWDDPIQYDLGYTYLSNSELGVDSFDLYTGRAELTSSTETDFALNDDSKFVQAVTHYIYNSYYNYEVNETTTTKSNGDVVNQYFSYTSDYPSTTNGAINVLNQHNIVAAPVSTHMTVVNPTIGSGELALSEKITTYMQLPGGDVLPSAVLEQRFTKPIAGVAWYSPDNIPNPAVYKTAQAFTYDGNSDLIGMKDEGGRTVTSIYGYNDKYTVAKVVNADAVLDRPAYTSFETSDPDWLGGWNLTGSASASPNAGAMTGTQSLQLGSATLSSRLNLNKEYIVSFWSTSSISVSPGSLEKSGPSINGFTYYEYAIPGGSDNVIVAGNTNIDELRLYPKMARMATTTYDPLIGKTSECDINNRISYYDYDNLGRLRFIKDENHNIVKMYEYNNVSPAKQNGCPGTYSNQLVTEMFDKTNCNSGYRGNRVAYSVPAGRYTSTISQEDVDGKVEQDLLTNGPTNANTSASGSCAFIYHNIAWSQTFTTQSCDPGQQGGTVTYNIPANVYSSIVSQDDADQPAKDELAANGQAYANAPATRSCSLYTSPDWNYTPGDPTICATIGGTSYIMDWAIDLNPNSPTYNTWSWQKDSYSPTACPIPPTVYVRLSLENVNSDGADVFADVVVSFWQDAAGTIPAMVYNLSVNTMLYRNCDFQQDSQAGTYTNLSGSSFVLRIQAPITYEDDYQDGEGNVYHQTCNYQYVIESGGGYVSIN